MTTLTIAFQNFANVPKSQYNTAFAELERPCQQIQSGKQMSEKCSGGV